MENPIYKFHVELGWHEDRQRFAYYVYEIGTSRKILCIVSPARYIEPEIAMIHGINEAGRLHVIMIKHGSRRLRRKAVS